MSRFNSYMNNHFAGCKLLAEAWDDARKRDVRIYCVPGHMDAVGITDGTDAWVAPVAASCFSVNIERQMADLHSGIAGKFEVVRRHGREAPRRTRVRLGDPAPAPRLRVRLDDKPAERSRSRVRL